MNINIIKLCEDYKEYFKEIIKDIAYEDRGIFNSEMLLFIAIAKYFNVEEIWESGRARGQSTEIIASCFNDIIIYSIECDSKSVDVEIANNRLKKYHNLELIYDNSITHIPASINNETVVLIDGPKGMQAINLAKTLLTNKKVKAVFLHDYHKDSPLRKVLEHTFDNSFFTDDAEYVKAFRDLDDKCWINHAKIGRYPYRRNTKKMQSYSSTLCVLFNTL